MGPWRPSWTLIGFISYICLILIVLGFNETSTTVGHFVSVSQRKGGKRRRDSRGDEREGQGRKIGKANKEDQKEETEEIYI